MFAKVLRSRLALIYGRKVDSRLNSSENRNSRECQTFSAATPVWSLYNCKRVVKSSKYGFTEGPACIETTCPCSDPSSGNKIYINKISGKITNFSVKFRICYNHPLFSGNFICPKCHYTGKFSAIEDFFPEPKAKDQQVDVAQKREKFQRRKQGAHLELPSVDSIKDHSDADVEQLLKKFSVVRKEAKK